MKDEEIIQKIRNIQKNFKAELEDSPEEDRLSFLDCINDLIRSIFNDSSVTVYDVFSKEELEKWKKKSFSRKIKKIFFNNYKNTFYFLLLVTITGFLVSEALEFYSTNSILDTKTYIKAILTEVCFVFLSGYRPDDRIQRMGTNVLRVSIFCLMIFVITSKTFMDSAKNYSNTNVIQEQVLIIKKQIKEKEKDIRHYRDVKQWPNTIRQLTKERDELVKKLIELKEKQAAGATIEISELIRYKAYGNAFFRVILLFISILITRRIFSF